MLQENYTVLKLKVTLEFLLYGFIILPIHLSLQFNILELRFNPFGIVLFYQCESISHSVVSNSL